MPPYTAGVHVLQNKEICIIICIIIIMVLFFGTCSKLCHSYVHSRFLIFFAKKAGLLLGFQLCSCFCWAQPGEGPEHTLLLSPWDGFTGTQPCPGLPGAPLADRSAHSFLSWYLSADTACNPQISSLASFFWLIS